jgi:hypothetical protein
MAKIHICVEATVDVDTTIDVDDYLSDILEAIDDSDLLEEVKDRGYEVLDPKQSEKYITKEKLCDFVWCNHHTSNEDLCKMLLKKLNSK